MRGERIAGRVLRFFFHRILKARVKLTFAPTWPYCADRLCTCTLVHRICLTTVYINFSQIYCRGPILHQVQMAKFFDDDKYFVDMKLRESPGKSVGAFILFQVISSLLGCCGCSLCLLQMWFCLLFATLQMNLRTRWSRLRNWRSS